MDFGGNAAAAAGRRRRAVKAGVVAAVAAVLAGAGVLGAHRAAVAGETPPPGGGGFHPVDPARVTGAGLAVGPGRWVSVPVLGAPGIPTTGVGAVLMTVTASSPVATQLAVRTHPAAAAPPSVDLAVRAGEPHAGSVHVAPAPDGTVAVFNRSGTATVHLDVVGWDDLDGSGARYKVTGPTGRAAPTLTIGAGRWATVPVAGVPGLPASGVTAVAVQVSGTSAPGRSDIAVRSAPLPAGAAPATSTVSLGPNPAAALTTAAPAPDGTIALFNRSATATVAVDVVGWYDASGSGSGFTPVEPARVTPAPVTVTAGRWTTVKVLGTAGTPATDVGAVTVNLTVTATTPGTRVSAATAPTPSPARRAAAPPAPGSRSAFSVPVPAGGTATAQAVLSPSGDGTIALTSSSGRARVTVDVVGVARFTCTTRTLVTVAHEDDDVLFLDPDLHHDVSAGACDRTVYLTAGDADTGWSDHARQRERAARTVHARLRGVGARPGDDVDAHYSAGDAGIAGHPAAQYTLNDDPRTTLVFLRLEDGDIDGSDCYAWDADGRCTSTPPPPLTRYESLGLLYGNAIPAAHALDGSTSYTRAQLVAALGAVISSFQPTVIRTQDYTGHSGIDIAGGAGSDLDHNDHHVAGRFTADAAAAVGRADAVVTYKGYPELQIPYVDNVAGADKDAKQALWDSYLPFDDQGTYDGDRFGQAIARQYPAPPAAPIQAADGGACATAPPPGDATLTVGPCTGAPGQTWTFTTAGLLTTADAGPARCLDVGPGVAVAPRMTDCTAPGVAHWTVTGMGEVRVGDHRCLEIADGRALVNACAGRATQRLRIGGQPPRPTVEIHGLNGLCLTADLPETADGGPSPVMSGSCEAWPDSQWVADTPSGEVRGDWSTKCLTGSPAAVTLATCDGTASQRWAWSSDGTVQLTGTGSCLDLVSTVGDTPAALTPCGTHPGYQRWALGADIASPVRSATTGACLDGAGVAGTPDPANGTPVVMAPCSESTTQRWTHTSEAQELRVLGGRCLDNRNGSDADGSVVQVWDCADNANQRWLVHDDGSVEWASMTGRSGRCLTANDSGAVGLYACGAFPASQRFAFP